MTALMIFVALYKKKNLKSAAVGGWNRTAIFPNSKMNKPLSNIPPFQFVSVDKNWTEVCLKQS